MPGYKFTKVSYGFVKEINFFFTCKQLSKAGLKKKLFSLVEMTIICSHGVYLSAKSVQSSSLLYILIFMNYFQITSH